MDDGRHGELHLTLQLGVREWIRVAQALEQCKGRAEVSDQILERLRQFVREQACVA